VIIEGEADVVRGGKKVAALGPGAFFGELAILDLAPRDATIVASTPIEAVVLSRDDFRQALVEVPAMTIRLLAGMARRLREFDLPR
jgi:CRP-like cAMP-binding protein